MVPIELLRPHPFHTLARFIFFAAAGVAVHDRGELGALVIGERMIGEIVQRPVSNPWYDSCGGHTGKPAMTPTRALLALTAVAATVAIDVAPAAAQYRPWCAQYMGSRGGGRTCTFYTYEQCMMTATPGSGAFCVQNPWYLYGDRGARTTGRGDRSRW